MRILVGFATGLTGLALASGACAAPTNSFAPVFWGTDGMVYICKQPWRVSERSELPFISNFYRTEAILDDHHPCPRLRR